MSLHTLILLAQAQEQGLTLRSVLEDIPHDATAFIIYLLTGASIWAVVHYGRKGSGGSSNPPQGGQAGKV